MTVKRFHAEIVTACLTGALGIAAVIGATELGWRWSERGPQPGYFPFYVGLILLGASLWNMGSAFVRHRRAMAEGLEGAAVEEPFLDRDKVKRLGGFLGAMLAFVVATMWLGIYIGSAGYITYSAWRKGGYPLLLSLAIGFGFSVSLYVIFEVIFKIPLLKGPIEPMLGIY